MTSRRDYFLMAGIFRKYYLRYLEYPNAVHRELLRDIVYDFMDMLQKDNPRFNRGYFINFIKNSFILYFKCKNTYSHRWQR